MKRAGDTPPSNNPPAKRPHTRSQTAAAASTSSAGHSNQSLFTDELASGPATPALFPPAGASSEHGYVRTNATYRKKARKEIDAWLNSLDSIAKNSLVSFKQGVDFPLPSLPATARWTVDIRPTIPSDVTFLHAGLITGSEKYCGGTNEVASWAATTLKLALSTNFTSKANPFNRVSFSAAEAAIVHQKLQDLIPKLEYLQKMRDLCRFSMNIVAYKSTANEQWTSFRLIVALHVMQELRKNGGVIFPADFGIHEEKGPDQGYGSHATSVIIDPLIGDLHAVRHIETNGRGPKWISRYIANEKRTLQNDPSRTLQRHWKFEPKDFRFDTQMLGYEENENCKVFMTRTAFVNFTCLSSSLSDHEIVEQLEPLANLLLPNAHIGFKNASIMEDYQDSMFRSLDEYFPYSERQRPYARQNTPSCELKSVTVAAGETLKDELSYQVLIFLLTKQAKEDFEKLDLGDDDPEQFRLTSALESVEKRVLSALHLREQP